MTARRSAIALALVLAGCGSLGCWVPSPDEASFARAVQPSCEGLPKADAYFPAGVFAHTADEDRRIRADLAERLTALREPALGCGTAESYRLRLGGPFGFQSDLTVRIAKERDTYVAVFTRGEEIEARTRKPLTSQQWDALAVRVRLNDLWLRPTRPDASSPARIPMPAPWVKPKGMLDGESWWLEIREGRRYHVVFLDPHTEHAAILDLCRIFFDLAGAQYPAALEH